MQYYFTVITPTYNRAEYLTTLYNSLKNQHNVSFEWVVVDDGSTDETRELVYKFIKKENDFQIKYLYKENGGKHTAVNLGIDNALGKYITIIDSDDYLVKNGLNIIKKILTEHNADDIIGVSACKIDNHGNSVSFINSIENQVMSHYDWFYTHKRTGDRIDFYRSEILKGTKFNSFTNETFLTEDTLWLNLKGNKIYSNNQILIVEYLEDGLTSNYNKLLTENPMGMIYYYYSLLNHCKENNKKPKLKYSLLLLYYSVRAIIKKSSITNSIITYISIPLICLIKSLRK